MPRIRNGGAEYAGDVILLGSAEIRSDLGSHGGLGAFYLFASRSSIGPVLKESSARWFNVPTLPGLTYEFSFWADGTSASGARLQPRVDLLNGSSFTTLASLAATGAGWKRLSVTFTAAGLWTALGLRATVPSGNSTGYWLVDDVSVGSDMAVMLSEFSVRSVLSVLQANLNQEIRHVRDEANLGLDLPVVTGWRCYDPGIATPDVTEVEVYEIGDVLFPSDKYDQSTWHGGRTRVLSMIPMRVALNHANRGNATSLDATLYANQMATRSRLYGAAIVRTLRNNPDCGQIEKIVVEPGSLRYMIRNASRASEELRRVARTEFDFTVHLQESSADETTVGGGGLPAVTLETP